MRQNWVGELFILGGESCSEGASIRAPSVVSVRVRERVCVVPTSHLPHGVGGITGADLVADEAVETCGTEPLLAIRAFKARFTQAGPVDVMTLGSVLTLARLVTLRTEAAHGTVVLTPGGQSAAVF